MTCSLVAENIAFVHIWMRKPGLSSYADGVRFLHLSLLPQASLLAPSLLSLAVKSIQVFFHCVFSGTDTQIRKGNLSATICARPKGMLKVYFFLMGKCLLVIVQTTSLGQRHSLGFIIDLQTLKFNLGWEVDHFGAPMKLRIQKHHVSSTPETTVLAPTSDNTPVFL